MLWSGCPGVVHVKKKFFILFKKVNGRRNGTVLVRGCKCFILGFAEIQRINN